MWWKFQFLLEDEKVNQGTGGKKALGFMAGLQIIWGILSR